MSNYYDPLSPTAFEEVKKIACEIWQSYDDTYGYASEKISKIKGINNIADNGMYIIAMFDLDNQRKMSNMLTDNTKYEIFQRLRGSEYAWIWE